MDKIPEITIRILNGNYSEEEMRVFMQWYNESAKNKELFFQLKHIYESSSKDQKLGDKELMDSWQRLAEKIKSTDSIIASDSFLNNNQNLFRNSVNKCKMRKILITCVAATLILIFVGIRINTNNNTWIEVRTFLPGETKIVDLPDGSIVHLNALSTLKYPKKFNKKSRDLFLDGEAYFNVSKDSLHPFIVYSDNQEIEVLGTEFNVQAYSTEDIAVTTLISGKVKLTTSENKVDLGEEFILEPGHQAIFNKNTNCTQVIDVETKDVTSWINGEYAFKNKSLEEITIRLEKIYNVTFLINDDSLKKSSYSGKFFSHQTIDEIVNIINFKNHFNYEINNDTIIIKCKTHKQLNKTKGL